MKLTLAESYLDSYFSAVLNHYSGLLLCPCDVVQLRDLNCHINTVTDSASLNDTLLKIFRHINMRQHITDDFYVVERNQDIITMAETSRCTG
jgi:hypothetical protein